MKERTCIFFEGGPSLNSGALAVPRQLKNSGTTTAMKSCRSPTKINISLKFCIKKNITATVN